jgi:hypothetical protein
MSWRAAMTWRVAPVAVAALAVVGCARRVAEPPRAGTANVVLEVGAKPKAGAAERLARVPVYDAAPRPAAVMSGQFERVDYADLGDIIVWLEPAPADAPRFSPVVVAVDPARSPEAVHAASVGREVVFRNRGDAPVSLYSVSDENDFELPDIPPGGEARYTVRAPGLIEVLADPSRPPVATLYAAPSPWVRRARAGESVLFRDVPPGTYEAVSWHPRLPGKSASLSLAPDQVTRSTLDVGVKNISAEGPQR